MDTGSPLEHAQQLVYRIVELVDDAFLQRDDGIFRNRDVLRAHLRATPCDVAETDAVAAPAASSRLRPCAPLGGATPRAAAIVGAVIGTLGGRRLRGKMAAAFGNDHPAAFVEDALAIALAVAVVMMLP